MFTAVLRRYGLHHPNDSAQMCFLLSCVNEALRNFLRISAIARAFETMDDTSIRAVHSDEGCDAMDAVFRRTRAPRPTPGTSELAQHIFLSASLLGRLGRDRTLPLRRILRLNMFFIVALPLCIDPLAAEDHHRSGAPIIYDAMAFADKPDLGLSRDVSFIYEWEATLRDESRELKLNGLNREPSSRTIETEAFSSAVVLRRGKHKFVVIDIESLEPKEDRIAISYLNAAKAAAPDIQFAWWNTGPSYIVDSWQHPFDRSAWLENWRKRYDLERANDFFIFGSYFLDKADTVESWAKREIPRVIEARLQFPEKAVFVAIAPHPFLEGKPWQHVSSELFGGIMDQLAQAGVDGIVLWSFEGNGRVQKWNEAWEWVGALRKRIGPGGHYRAL